MAGMWLRPGGTMLNESVCLVSHLDVKGHCLRNPTSKLERKKKKIFFLTRSRKFHPWIYCRDTIPHPFLECEVVMSSYSCLPLRWHICSERPQVNYSVTVLWPVSDQSKRWAFVFFKCPNTECNCFTFARQHTNQNKLFPRVGYLVFLHLTCEETKAVSWQKQSNWCMYTLCLLLWQKTYKETVAQPGRDPPTGIPPPHATNRQCEWKF